VVNQGIRVVGSEGMLEIDTQDRGARGCFSVVGAGRGRIGSPGMQTFNPGFFMESRDAQGRTRYGGYGIESIQNFAENVKHLLAGGSAEDFRGTYADAQDGLEVTRIAVAVHRSAEAGGALVDLDGI